MPKYNGQDALHEFNDIHIDKTFDAITGHHENELFFNCIFRKVKGLVLRCCSLNRSKFEVENIEDAMDFTVTLNCFSFHNVEYSPELFDYMVTLLILTKGNVEKRQKLIEVVGRDRLREIFGKIQTFIDREK